MNYLGKFQKWHQSHKVPSILIIIASIVVGLASFTEALDKSFVFLRNLATGLWAFGNQLFSIPAWLIIVFSICALFATVQLAYSVALRVRPPHARLWRSLSHNEQSILTLLAQSNFGLTEGELSDSIRVSSQQFLHFIDRLVHELRLVERTETTSGGAFWALSDKGRNLAATNSLFPR